MKGKIIFIHVLYQTCFFIRTTEDTWNKVMITEEYVDWFLKSEQMLALEKDVCWG